MQGPFVMKIGGSLINEVPVITSELLASPVAALIIPGGGPFANLVRSLHVPDNESHWMAVLGMEQYGWYISSFGIRTSPELRVPEHPAVFLPYSLMRDMDPLPHKWDITSDTIAAWVAYRLGLDLIVLKSVDGIMKGDTLQEQVTTPVACDEVDPGFVRFVLQHGVRTLIINGKKKETFQAFLRGEQVEGTRIGTTF
ncbi:MAG: uridylate kinase [Methanoregulaceae archaeon]|nr:uridylate kinase [Methanoregulaceae archaeon]